MIAIMMVTSNKDHFQELASDLSDRSSISIQWADSGEAALSRIAGAPPAVAVVDDTLPDMSGLAFVRKLLAVNPWVQTAVASRLSPQAFHEASEGLGVMACLPANPGAADAQQLIELMGQAFVPADGA